MGTGEYTEGAVAMGILGGSGRREAQTSAWTWGLFHAALAASAMGTAALVVVLLEPRLRDAGWLRSRVGMGAVAAVGLGLALAMGVGGLIVRASRAMAYECSIRRGVIPDLIAGSWLLAVPATAIVAAAARVWTEKAGAGVGLLALYLAWSWGVGVVAFLTYGADKHVAIERGRGREDFGRRTPESGLQVFSLLGGAPGAMLAQRVFRHKTSDDKRGFRARVWLLAIVHYVAVAGLAFLLLRREG